MFDRLDMFRLSGALASHASLRQSVTTHNIAQADTPGYRAQTVTPFAEAYGAEAMPMRATRPGHLLGGEPDAARVLMAKSPAEPNGNSVSIEQEMGRAAMARSDHDRALAVYRHGLAVLRAGLGRR